MENEHLSIKLNELLPGECGTITAVHTEGIVKYRLMDLGIIPGASVEIENKAPLGDPLKIKVQNTHIALRKSEASTILIDKDTKRYGTTRRRHRAGR